MTEIKARVPIVDIPKDAYDKINGGRAPKYSWRDDVSFNGDYAGNGDPIIRFRVGKDGHGDKFAGDLASDPHVQILGRSK